MSAVEPFDVIVIGGGTGRDVVLAAESHGLSVALVEQGPLGGTCHNRGCMPTKMLIHSADLTEAIGGARRFGIDASRAGVDLASMVARVFGQLDEETREREAALRANPRIRFFQSEGRFVGPRELAVAGTTITAPRIVIAAGSRPAIPDLPGLAEVPYLTSDEALHLHDLPQRLVILGGGYIAAELAHLFGALGAEVTIVARAARLLDREDHEIADRFTRELASRQRVMLGTTAVGVRRTDTGIELALNDGSRVEGDQLLVATGRRPNSDTLGLEAPSVELDARGHIVVNDRFETSGAGIWAFGDVVGLMPLKHVAVRQARNLSRGLFDGDWQLLDYSRVPRAVFSSPQVAAVGATEEELRASGIRYKVGRHELAHTGMGMALAETGLAKVLASADNRILGCHIVGPHASILIHEAVVAMGGSGRLQAITESVHAHPAQSQLLEEACKAALAAPMPP